MDAIISLDSYDDVFDDFDIRPYKERSLSADFINVLNERVKKVDFAREMTLILTMPKKSRNRNHERAIEKRLREHLESAAKYWSGKAKDTRNSGIFYLLLGLAIYVAGGVIGNDLYIARQYLLIPSWFLIWHALDLIVMDIPKINAKRDFNRYVCNARITFRDAEYFEMWS
jgi:hypothetical protein